MTTDLRQWIERAAELEPELLRAPPLDGAVLDVAVRALDRGAHLRLVVDLLPLDEPRLRVRVVEPAGGWWLSDSWARVAPAAHALGTATG